MDPHEAVVRIGIIGSGTLGSALGGLFARHGHEVLLGSRRPKPARAAEIGARISREDGGRAAVDAIEARLAGLTRLSGPRTPLHPGARGQNRAGGL